MFSNLLFFTFTACVRSTFKELVPLGHSLTKKLSKDVMILYRCMDVIFISDLIKQRNINLKENWRIMIRIYTITVI